MNPSWFAGVLLFALTPVVADTVAETLAPSDLMRRIPAIPQAPATESCAVTDELLSLAEQYGTTEMMRTQQMAMSAMTAGGSAVSDKQGELIQRLLDPAVTMCDMNVSQAVASADATGDLVAELSGIQQKARREAESKCPVTGMADYREPACVDPVIQRGYQEEQAAIIAYIARANTQLETEVDGFARCAVTRETLANEAEAARIPVQFLSMALSSRAGGWQTAAALVQRYKMFCTTAADAGRDLQMRMQAH